MLLEKNGRGSSSKRTRHINIRYFFVADRVAAGEVKIEYCPTADMLADFFTKPLQGSIFRKFRDFILNLNSDPVPTMSRDHRSVLRKHPITILKQSTSGKYSRATSRNLPGCQPSNANANTNAKRAIINEFRGTANSAVASY
jgi:hypothetical protein